MTSLLRRKRQITPPNTLLRTQFSLVVGVSAAFLWLAGWAGAEDLAAGAAHNQPAPSNHNTATITDTSGPQQGGRSKDRLSPLERLKQRSPEKRWAERVQQWKATRGNRAEEENRDPVKSRPSTQKDSAAKPTAAAPPFPDKTLKLLPASIVEKHWSEYVSLRQPQQPQRYPEPVRNPKELKKITEILPYSDYEPDAETRRTNPCQNLCPRPDQPRCQAEAAQPEAVCPEEIRFPREALPKRVFQERAFRWAASNLYYNPLYFEDVPLERYGHSHGDLLQPFVSVAKFGVQLVGLPYQMTIDPVRKKIYPLGYYRPGECAPKKYYQIPFNLEAALREAGVWTALVFIFP